MSYMYNALNCNNYNGLTTDKHSGTFGAKDSSRPVVGAPSNIPKYSIENELNKREEFRNHIHYENGNKKKDTSSAISKVAVVSSAAAIALLAMSKTK